MRLYDKLLAERGKLLDHAMQGAVSKLYADLVQAQCFQISADISAACVEVCDSKPSSMLSAMHLLRTPYSHTWIEWSPSERERARENYKPVPRRVGMLLVTDADCRAGWSMLAWEHIDDSLMMNPFGLCFNWREDDKSAVEIYAQTHKVPGVLDIVADKRRWLSSRTTLPERWEKYRALPGELEAAVELELRANVIPLDACMEHLGLLGIMPGTGQYESYIDDLSGELPFVEAFLLLLNSRNSIVEQKRDDFSRLNRARQRARKMPLREFVTTSLKLSRVQGNRAIAAGYSRETARLHLVRGHFKVRAGGVFWWSPHTRGKGEAVKRATYKVS